MDSKLGDLDVFLLKDNFYEVIANQSLVVVHYWPIGVQYIG